jgi:flagellar hook assembly protein FlgD
MGVVTFHDQFSVNAVVVYGTKPSLTNLHVTPPIYGPAAGPQTIAFTLTTFQNQPVTVTSKFLNQDSLSTLRTVTATAVSPGNVSLTWDGRADNGAWVAPGLYTVTVTVTDSIGNVIQSQILTTIRY